MLGMCLGEEWILWWVFFIVLHIFTPGEDTFISAKGMLPLFALEHPKERKKGEGEKEKVEEN